MSPAPFLALALALAACTGDVRSTKITPELVEHPASVTNRLAPADRPVFARYILSRALASVGSIPILTAAGKDPATVGEALTLTRHVMALEAERDAKMEAASKRQDEIAKSPAYNTPEGIAAYSAAVHDYNSAMDEFNVKLGLKK